MHFHAGQTPHSEQFEVFANGEHLVDAFAADDAEGWADCHVMGEQSYLRTQGVLNVVRVVGVIEIRRCNTEAWPMATASKQQRRAELMADLADEKQANQMEV